MRVFIQLGEGLTTKAHVWKVGGNPATEAKIALILSSTPNTEASRNPSTAGRSPAFVVAQQQSMQRYQNRILSIAKKLQSHSKVFQL
jgi:hypothetical protein